jgi:putative ABC transport system permease protein
LGATRGQIATLVIGRTLIPAGLGAILGGIAAAVWGRTQTHAPGPDFTIAVAVLCLLAAAIAAVPPALIAITRDPVRVLRTP